MYLPNREGMKVKAWLGGKIGLLREGWLSDAADSAQLVLVDNLDFASVDGNQLVGGKLREGADGIGGGHVGEAGQILARKVDAERASVSLKTVDVAKEQEGLGKTSSDVFLCEVYGSLVCRTESGAEFFNEEPPQCSVLLYYFN